MLEESSGDYRNVEVPGPTPGVAKPEDTMGIEHIDGLYGYALVLTRNRMQAEDLVQETYVRALEAIPRLREQSNIKGWLFTILRNLWLNELRRSRSAPHLVEMDFEGVPVEGIASNTRDSHDILSSKEDAERVRVAVEKLPVDFREIIVLREFEEMSYQEIAEVLGCPAGTVMSRLGRARAKLRNLLAPRWNPQWRAKKGIAP
jgi:RNA polymerase sigma-70 factor, ECF subfamily